MKLILRVLLLSCTIALTISCNKEENRIKSDIYNEFCSSIPATWNAEIKTNGYESEEIIKFPNNPPAFVIKYTKPGYNFKHHGNTVNPQLVLNFYTIEYKEQLLRLIGSQILESWCITCYYGETDNYFVVTSPCFINHGHIGCEHAEHIVDLNKSLYEVISVKNYFDNCSVDSFLR